MRKRKTNQSVREDSTHHREEVAHKLENPTRNHDSRPTYQILKEAIGKKFSVPDFIKDERDNTISDCAKKVERWKMYFSELLKPEVNATIEEDNTPLSVSKELYCINPPRARP